MSIYKSNFHKKNIFFLLAIFILVFSFGSLITLIYSYLIWYLQAIGLSLIFFYLVSKIYAYLIVQCYGKSFLKSFSQELNNKFYNFLFLLIHLLIFWYVYWIFWIDLMVNQHSWQKVDYSWLPFDYFRITHTDIKNILFLMLNPDRVISFLEVNIKYGYFQVFGETVKDEMIFIFWVIEFLLMNYIVYNNIYNDNKKKHLLIRYNLLKLKLYNFIKLSFK